MRVRYAIAIGLVSALAAMLLLNLTTPDSIGPAGVLGLFVLLYITILCVTYTSLKALQYGSVYFIGSAKLKRMIASVSNSKLYSYATVIALAPVIALGMRSTGHIGMLEMALLVAFEGIACFFVYKKY